VRGLAGGIYLERHDRGLSVRSEAARAAGSGAEWVVDLHLRRADNPDLSPASDTLNKSVASV